MKFKTLSGKEKAANINKYLINWEGKCRGKSKWGKFQFSVKDFLRPFWERQVVCEEFPCFGTAGEGKKNLRLDLINISRSVAIEVNGVQHQEYNPFFHGTRHGFLRQIERDSRKSDWCDLNDIELIHILPEDELSVKWFEEKYGIIL